MPSHFDQALVEQIPVVRSIGHTRLTDAGELEDFVQETLLRAYTRRDQLGDVDRLPQWVHAIARNTAINWNRDRKYLPMLSDAIGDSADGADVRMEAAERFRALRSALMALPACDREMLVAHVVDGVPYGDLQARYGLSNSAVGVRLHRAKRRVRQRLGVMLGAAVCGVKLGARQAMGATIMTAKWKTAVLVGAAVGGVVAVGVWQVTRPGADASPEDHRAESATATPAPSASRPSATTLVRRADSSASPAAGRGAAGRESGGSATAAARSNPAVTTSSVSVKPAPVVEPGEDTTAGSLGSGGGAIESGVMEATMPDGTTGLMEIQDVGGGLMQVRLPDGVTALLTTSSDGPLPEGVTGRASTQNVTSTD